VTNVLSSDPATSSLKAPAHDVVAQAYLDMLQREVETTPEVDRIEFAGGAEVIYRDLSRLRAERHHIVHTLLKTLRSLAGERRFVDHLDASDAWLLLLPLLRAPPQLRDAAVATLAAAAAASPNASAALAELGAAEDLVHTHSPWGFTRRDVCELSLGGEK